MGFEATGPVTQVAGATTRDGALWVFAYGSLMWRPGFAFSEAVHARLHGYRRAFCIYSVQYRGTLKRPGLVLGLERGGLCEGIAFRIDAEQACDVLHYLRQREQINGVYREKVVHVALAGPEPVVVAALTFVAERRHPSFARALPLERQARIIRGASGNSGANVDYLINTIRHLEELKIRDRRLERLLTVTGSYFANGREDGGHRARAKPLSARQSLRQLRISPSSLTEGNPFVHRSVLAGI